MSRTLFAENDPFVFSGEGWQEQSNGTWKIGIRSASMEVIEGITPWLRVYDYHLPGYLETSLPDAWICKLRQLEQNVARRPIEGHATRWKQMIRPWGLPGTEDELRCRWDVETLELPVYVGRELRSEKLSELVPGQWIRLKVRLEGFVWDGSEVRLQFTVEQVLLRSGWKDEAKMLASRAIDTARTKYLWFGVQEEKILSLKGISS